jgi:hypothetical protein
MLIFLSIVDNYELELIVQIFLYPYIMKAVLEIFSYPLNFYILSMHPIIIIQLIDVLYLLK